MTDEPTPRRALPDQEPASHATPADADAAPTRAATPAAAAGQTATDGAATHAAATDAAASDGASVDGPRDGARAARPTRRRRRRALAAFGWIVGILLLVLALAAAALAWRAHVALQDIPRNSSFMPTHSNRPVDVPGGPQAFVLIGSDDSEQPDRQEGVRSDSLMIAYVPANRQHVYLISVPRDLWVDVPGLGYAKINKAYEDKGVPGTVEVLEKMLDVRMNHVGMINFDGFMKLMDVLGGVDVYNPEYSEYWYEGEDTPRHIFKPGMLHLEGEYGLAYVRQRKGLPNGDLDRTARQRSVIKAIIGKALSKGVLTNPVVMDQFLRQITSVVQVDSDFTEARMIGMATSMKIHGQEDVRPFMLPIAGYDESADGQSIDVPDEDAIAELADAMKHDTMDAWWADHGDDPLITDNRPYPPGEAPLPGSSDETPSPTALPTSTAGSGTATPGGFGTSRGGRVTPSRTREITNPVTTPTAYQS